MFDCFKIDWDKLSECDLLALNTLIVSEIMKKVKNDVDTLGMLGDLFSSIGANLCMVANRRSLRLESLKCDDLGD